MLSARERDRIASLLPDAPTGLGFRGTNQQSSRAPSKRFRGRQAPSAACGAFGMGWERSRLALFCP